MFILMMLLFALNFCVEVMVLIMLCLTSVVREIINDYKDLVKLCPTLFLHVCDYLVLCVDDVFKGVRVIVSKVNRFFFGVPNFHVFLM